MHRPLLACSDTLPALQISCRYEKLVKVMEKYDVDQSGELFFVYCFAPNAAEKPGPVGCTPLDKKSESVLGIETEASSRPARDAAPQPLHVPCCNCHALQASSALTNCCVTDVQGTRACCH